jgi:hypothetical protein
MKGHRATNGSKDTTGVNSHSLFMVTRDHDPFNRNLGPLIIYECSIYKVIDQLFK